MKFLKGFLKLINGRKTTIATILGAVLVFLLGREIIASDVAELISGILVVLGLGVNYTNYRLDKPIKEVEEAKK